LKEKISTTPILAHPDLKQPFEIQTNRSEYSMGVFFMHHGNPISYHYKTFTNVVINYPTYDKDSYDLVKNVKK